MKKTNHLLFLLDSIFLIVFNLLFFLVGGSEHYTSVWISYGFIHFAYFMLIISPILVRNGRSTAVFGFSIFSIVGTYFFVQLVVGVVFILVESESYKISLIVQLITAGIYAAFLISHMIANEHTADAQEVRQYQVDYIKQATGEVTAMIQAVSDLSLKKKLEKVYDAMSTSQVKTHPKVMQIESEILYAINDLRASCKSNHEKATDQATALLILIEEKNRKLRLIN